MNSMYSCRCPSVCLARRRWWWSNFITKMTSFSLNKVRIFSHLVWCVNVNLCPFYRRYAQSPSWSRMLLFSLYDQSTISALFLYLASYTQLSTCIQCIILISVYRHVLLNVTVHGIHHIRLRNLLSATVLYFLIY